MNPLAHDFIAWHTNTRRSSSFSYQTPMPLWRRGHGVPVSPGLLPRALVGE